MRDVEATSAAVATSREGHRKLRPGSPAPAMCISARRRSEGRDLVSAISCGSYLCLSPRLKSALQDQRWLNLATLLRGPASRLRVRRAGYQSLSLCRGIASLFRTWPQARRVLPAPLRPSALAHAQCRPSPE